MPILSKSQLAALRQRNDMEISKGSHGTYGWPTGVIRDLLMTIDEERKRKNKLQRICEKRGAALQKIVEAAAAVALADTDENEIRQELD